MRVCGVDFKSNEANICLVDLSQGLFDVPDCRARKFTITDGASTEQIRLFQRQFFKLMEDYKVDKIIIRERPMKGKFAGSAVGFKMEAALQLIESVECEVFTASEMKESMKRNPIMVSMKEVGLKQFQEPAFQVACAYLNK
ncbi:DUF3010 family protein [Enterovibrio sp. ZSDZ35]|uniref:DUF3010 family protein n=1 Tax=Enterovibrio qingdaonensis TaxID=2899818 RepID=A0ABT5QG42_9GAMM|nr:DUF3010 family protein [Enterovibrio sp. ZSDZ35]MDD1779609.1 DUF3010 family protein [Enterovibrio sp. ZSDZ35]